MKKMKLRLFLTIILFLPLVLLTTNAQTRSTLELAEFLKLFNNEFTTEYKIMFSDEGIIYLTNIKNDKTVYFAFDSSRYLNNIRVKLDNDVIISPEMQGFAYAYKKINNNILYLLCYSRGEVGYSLYLKVLDLKNNTISKYYKLADAWGDEGDWGYKYGKFINDSTYEYLQVYKSEEKILDKVSGQYQEIQQTIDSISGQDRIRTNGEIIELKKTKLIK